MSNLPVWDTPVYGDLGPCRIQLTPDSAWDDSWEILRWNPKSGPVIRKRAYTGSVREEFSHFPIKQIEVRL